MPSSVNISKKNITAAQRNAVNKHGKKLVEIAERSNPLIDKVRKIDPNSLLESDHSALFSLARAHHKQLASVFTRIRTEIPDGYDYDILTGLVDTDLAIQLRPLRIWEETETEILKRVVVKSVMERIEKQLDSETSHDMHPGFIPSGRLFIEHYVKPICKNAGLFWERPSGRRRIETIANSVLDQDFESFKTDRWDIDSAGYFRTFYFWNGIPRSYEEKDAILQEYLFKSFDGILQLFEERRSWLRPGSIEDFVTRAIYDRINFRDGIKAASFVRYCVKFTGEILKSSHKFFAINGRTIYGLMPALPTVNEVYEFSMEMAQQDFLQRFSAKNVLDRSDAQSACLNNCIPDASKTYEVRGIVPNADELISILRDRGEIRLVDSSIDFYERRRRGNGVVDPNFY